MSFSLLWIVIGVILVVELFTHAEDLAALRWRPMQLTVTANRDCSEPLEAGTLVTLTGSVANLPKGYVLQWWVNEELRFQWPGSSATIRLMHFTDAVDCVIVRVIESQSGTIATESTPTLITWATIKEDPYATRK